MDTIVRLITNSAGALLARYKERLRHFVPGADAPATNVLVDQAMGLARLELPEGWRPAKDLNDAASIEAVHSFFGRHVIVISDAIEDFVPEMTVYEHSVNTRAELTNSIRLISCSGPERRTVGGFAAVQYEIEGFYQQTRIKYLHTTVAGQRAYHQVLAWATHTRYDRQIFERLLNGFGELPDLETAIKSTPPLSAEQPLHVVPVSDYEVH
jgi:hypothetical protein